MNRRAIALLVFSSAIYGLDIITVKKGLLEGISPYLFSILRTSLCALVALPFIISKRERIRAISLRHMSYVAVIGMIAEGIVIVLLFVGQHNTSAVNAGFLIRLTFLFTIPFAYVILGDRPGRILIVVLPMVAAGAFLISTGGSLSTPMKGDLLITSTAVMLGFTNALAKKTMKDVDADIVTSGRFVFGSLFLILLVLPFVYGELARITMAQHAYIFLSSAFYGCFVVSFYRSIDLAGPNIAAMFFTAGAVFSAAFAVLLLGESLSGAHVAGAVLLIGGAVILTRSRLE